MAGVARPVRVPTTPCWLTPSRPLLIQGGESFSHLCRRVWLGSLFTPRLATAQDQASHDS